MKAIKRIYLSLILLFLYVPIAVLIVQSFNAGVSRAKWEGFSLRWYQELINSPSIMQALYVTVTIALLAAAFSTVLGTLAAIGIHAMRKRPQAAMMTMTNIPMTMPDIVTGISLMLLFIFTRVDRGYFTMLLAHITFNTPYVVLSVLPKLKEMNKFSYEAARNLGATPARAAQGDCRPSALITGPCHFTLSLDDFTISYFTTSPVQNPSTLIYPRARKGIKPIMALSALMFVACWFCCWSSTGVPEAK